MSQKRLEKLSGSKLVFKQVIAIHTIQGENGRFSGIYSNQETFFGTPGI